jgi:hypothetical protein
LIFLFCFIILPKKFQNQMSKPKKHMKLYTLNKCSLWCVHYASINMFENIFPLIITSIY